MQLVAYLDMTVKDVYLRWCGGVRFEADRVYYWYADSEVLAIDDLENGYYDVHLMDKTVIQLHRYTGIRIQLVNWNE